MKIALLGYGKMGKAIERVATARGHEIVLTVDEYNRESVTDEQLKEADVAIEFSIPGVAVDHYLWCFRVGVPVVSGTTGWLSRRAEVEQACSAQQGGFFYASNFSVGVNIFFHLNRWLAKTMARFNDYRVSLEEVHHIHKLDAPSGTAITLAEGILENDPRYRTWELGVSGEQIIPIEAKREGEVPGIHGVTYQSEVDEITISHVAHTRDGFAIGAVMAAEFMPGKKGLYGMSDLLPLESFG